MAGRGSRFSREGRGPPKPLIMLQGLPLFAWAVESVRQAAPADELVFVVPSEHIRDHAIDAVIGAHYPDARLVVLDAAGGVVQTAEKQIIGPPGPHLLSRAYEGFAAKQTIRLLPEDQVYPFTAHDCWEGRMHDIEFWEQASRKAYVAHEWDGAGFRAAPTPRDLPWDIPTSVNGVEPAAAAESGPIPRISCLMASGGQLARARPAIEDYLRQTYARRGRGMLGPAAAAHRPRRHLGPVGTGAKSSRFSASGRLPLARGGLYLSLASP